jgi:hypothetical protein
VVAAAIAEAVAAANAGKTFPMYRSEAAEMLPRLVLKERNRGVY